MRGSRSWAVLTSLFVLIGVGTSLAAGPEPKINPKGRLVFLGDSITYSGQYVEDVEAYLLLTEPRSPQVFLNLGLPSETVSGLSEPGHADGKFPRPDLHERLDRVLALTKPDVIFACYGMNDGIYYPFDESRFKKYQEGIESFRRKAEAAGAQNVILLTPPVFDPIPIKARTLPAGLAEYPKPYVGYDDVLGRYSDWLLSRKGDGWDVVDVHGPMTRALGEARKRDPSFTFAGDGVHADAAGHWVIARAILKQMNVATRDLDGFDTIEAAVSKFPNGREVLKLVQERQRLRKDAWLSASGHKRPGMAPGLPLAEAEKKAAEIEGRIVKLLEPK